MIANQAKVGELATQLLNFDVRRYLKIEHGDMGATFRNRMTQVSNGCGHIDGIEFLAHSSAQAFRGCAVTLQDHSGGELFHTSPLAITVATATGLRPPTKGGLSRRF